MSVIGLRVGPFEIVQSTVVPEPGDWYRARRTGMTRRQPTEVLVKLLPPDADAGARAALQAEYDSLRAMEDPRVPAAVALYEGIGAIAIDAPDGVGLDEVVRARKLGSLAMTPATLLDIALEVAETLQHAHHRNRYHGHLSASSVRLSSQGKLTLFGFACGPRAPDPEWTSPERARGTPTGPATDQWALAALLAALISGSSPWDDEGDAERTRAHALKGDPERVVEPIERQWPALARLFRRMLDPDPDNRFPSMQPVRQELLALARKAGGSSERRELAALIARQVDAAPPLPAEPRAEPIASAPPVVAGPEPSAAMPPAAPPSSPEPGPMLAPDAPPPAEPVPEAVPEPAAPPTRATPAPAPSRSPPLPSPPEPILAERADPDEDVVLVRPMPLVAEALLAVPPDFAGGDVPRARRDDEDISDEPTVRQDTRAIAALSGADPLARVADLTSEDPTPEVVRALVAPPDPRRPGPGAAPVKARPVEGPTAVPTTDVSDDEGPARLPVTPRPPQPRAAPARPSRPPSTPVIMAPRSPDFDEPVQAARNEPVLPTRSAAQALAPWLVAGMIVLMLASVALALW